MEMPEFRSKRHAAIALFAAFALSATYKLYKQHIPELFGVSSNEYFSLQTCCTLFRILSTFIGFELVRRTYKEPRRYWKPASLIMAILIFIYPVTTASWQLVFLSPGTPEWKNFALEIFFNLFTASSEELLFRALILAGLATLTNFRIAILISSAYFAVWHYDTAEVLEMLPIFTNGLVFSIGYAGGAGLFTLIGAHFIWDQLVFGIPWSGNTTNGALLLLLFLELAFYVFLVQVAKRQRRVQAL